jgi:hypothetical protein
MNLSWDRNFHELWLTVQCFPSGHYEAYSAVEVQLQSFSNRELGLSGQLFRTSRLNLGERALSVY